jgi:antitoxin (DNA-binding transcriptional repressor) of toxin-antitoxin stability system
MIVVKINEAKSQLSRLIREIERGEEVVIARGKKPVAKLVAVEGTRPKRTPGLLKGKIKVSPDFDAPGPEEVSSPL